MNSKFAKIIVGKQVWVHALAWTLLLLLPLLVGSPANGYYIGSQPALFFSITVILHGVMFYANAYILYPKLYTLRRWFIYLMSAVGLVILIIFVKRSILSNWFPQVIPDKNTWRVLVAPTGVTFVTSIVYRSLRDKAKAEKEKQIQNAEALSNELKFLRSQISPHFLFNVLTNLVALARKKSDQLEPSLLMLSDLMRYMLYETRSSKISLRREIEYLESYIALQRLRLEEDIRLEINISHAPAGETWKIEPMLLIPFVENAFKHGPGFAYKSWIFIRLALKENILEFEVKNNFAHTSSESKDGRSGIGIQNVINRLKLLYKENYSLNIIKDKSVFSIQLTLILL